MAQASRATTFEDILDTPAAEVERPKPLPAGTYEVIVKGLPEHGESSQKKTPFCRFTYAVQAAGDDVDTDELQEIGGIEGKTIRDTYYKTEDAKWRLVQVLENMGIDDEGKTIRQMIDESPNCSLRIMVGHRTGEDGQQIFAEVKRTMKAD